MKTKGLRNSFMYAAIAVLLLLLSLFIINESKYHSLHHLINDHGIPFISLCISGFLFFGLLISNCLLSKHDLSKQNAILHNLRKKIGCITATDDIIIMQYDVTNQLFVRWDEVHGVEYRHFSLERYWTFVHPNDLPIAQKLIEYMNTQQTEIYVCEYRYLFPSAANYSWQLNEIFPFEYDKLGKPISYLGVCHKNDKMHEMQDQIRHFHEQTNYVTTLCGMGFGIYSRKNNSFHGADEKGDLTPFFVTIDNFIEKMHPDDRECFLSIADEMNKGQTKHLHAEYRSKLFSNSKDYNWYTADFVASKDNNDSDLYICLFRRNDEWHLLHDNLERFRKRVSFTSLSNGLGFVQYDVATDTFNKLDDKGELSDHNIQMDHWLKSIHPDDMHIATEMLEVLRRHKVEQYNAEYRYNFPDKYNWFSVNITAYTHDDNHNISSYMCLTRMNNVWHEMHDELKSYKNKVSLVTSLSGIIFAEFDTRTNILHCLNDEGNFKDFNMNLEEYYSYIHPEDRSKGEEVIEIMRKHRKEHFHTEYRFTHPWEKDYIWYSVDIAATEYDSNYNITGYTWLNRNNDAWHKAIDEMLELRGKVELAKMQSKFLSNINHEIRTPLNAIVGFSSIICDEESQEERIKYKNVIDKNNQKLLHIVDDVLLLSKIEGGDIVFKLSDVNLPDLFRNLTDEIRSTIDSDVQLICNDKPLSATVDVTYLKNVTSALLNNAIKFTRKGTITLDYAAKDNGLYVSVTDTGIGIDKEEQERIFERFEKIDSFKDGTGIGLPICKAIITKANGKIGLKSEPGKGSTFWFWVPRQTF